MADDDFEALGATDSSSSVLRVRDISYNPLGPMKQPTDVAQTNIPTAKLASKLNWVGMENIKIQLALGGLPESAGSMAAYVSLSQAEQRGIHMSRIYELVSNQFGKSLNVDHFKKLLKDMTESQKGSSGAAKLVFKTKVMLKRKALVSDKTGYKDYPVKIMANLNADGKFKISLSVRIDYSSTCPCSAALSREEISEQFAKHFKESGDLSLATALEWLESEKTWPAWPHAQRSHATGFFLVDPNKKFPDFVKVIDQMENALGTPTQTGVKRVDEKEFAKMNARNLMFCEDAARRLKGSFVQSEFVDYKFRVRHLESLHSHDVFAESSKNF